MNNSSGRFDKVAERLSNWPVEQISEAFEGWVELPEDFGAAERERLFSPLSNFLAVPFTGACR